MQEAQKNQTTQCLFILHEKGKEGMHEYFKKFGATRNELGWFIELKHEEEVTSLCMRAKMFPQAVPVPGGNFEAFKRANKLSFFQQKSEELKQKIDESIPQLGLLHVDINNPLPPELRASLAESPEGTLFIERAVEYQKLQNQIKQINNEELVAAIQPARAATVNTNNGKCSSIEEVFKASAFLDRIKNKTLEYQRTKRVELSGIDTGYPQLNNVLDGFQEEHLITLAGRTGMGKTWVCLNFAKNIAIDKKIPVSLFSLEMSNAQVLYRLLSLCSGITAHKIKKGMLNEQELYEVVLAYEKVKNSPLYITDCASNSQLATLARNIELECAQSKLIIVDHIGLVKAYDNSNNRANEVGEITRALKITAKNNKVPIMCLAQLNRNADKDEQPKISDLRESGAIEQDSDVVIFVHRSEYFDTQKRINEIDIIVAKNRDGEQNITIPFRRNDIWVLNEAPKNEIIKNEPPKVDIKQMVKSAMIAKKY